MRYIGDEGQELTETREAIRREMEMLRKRCDRMTELAFNLESELDARDRRIRELEGRLAKITPLTSLDAKEGSPPASALLNAPADQL
jgi:predicted  nucleic acid-binding Zn-ribbon protein